MVEKAVQLNIGAERLLIVHPYRLMSQWTFGFSFGRKCDCFGFRRTLCLHLA